MFIINQGPPFRLSQQMKRVCMMLMLLVAIKTQLLLTAITTTNSTLMATSTYNFSFSRFSTSSVPLNSYLLLTFNSQYASQIPTSPPCSVTGLGSAVSPSCSFSGSSLYVSQIFVNGSLLSSNSFTLSVSNIANPSPAGTYTPVNFIAIIAANSSTVQSGSASVGITITEGAASCLATTTNPYAFQNGQITVTYTSNYIPSGSSAYDILISIPTTYPDDPTATSLNASLSLSASLAVYPGVYVYQATFANSFTISMLMPPSTRPQSNFISIYTQTNSGTIGTIDSCSLTINNIQPNTFSTITISQGTVQTTTSLVFDLTLSTPLFQSDTLTITFPSGFSLALVGSSVTIASYGVLPLTRYDNSCLISSISSQAVLNARLIFSISGISMPFTTSPTSITVSLATTGNYTRIFQTYPYSALAGSLNVSVTCLNTEIGTTNTRCFFSFTTVSQISASGSLSIMFPSNFPLASGSSPCSVSGSGLNSNLNCLYTATNNTIQASSLTASTSNILPMPISLNVTVNMSQNVGNYSLALSTQSQGATVDLGYATLTTTARILKSGQFSVSSSSSVTYSSTTYTLFFSLPFDLGVTYTVSLTLPFDVQSGLSVSVSGGSFVSFSGSILKFTASQLTNNASISIGNLLTAVSLQPTIISAQVIYQQITYFTGSATITMTQLKQFTFADVGQSNRIVYSAAIATITLGGVVTGDKIMLSASYTGFYQSLQPNCSTGVVSCGVSGVITVLAANITGTITFTVNMLNLGYVGQSQLNITSYDSAQNYAKLSSVLTLSTTTPNAISIIANQTNPYLLEATTYSFSLTFTTPNPTALLVTPPSGLLISAVSCLLNCGNATKLTVGYLFPVSSTNCIITFSLTNPSAFSSSVKFVFKTSNSLGDMDYGEYVPQAVCSEPCRSCSSTNASVCLTCYSWSAQTILYNSTCSTACPIGYYQTTSSGVLVCSVCSSLCTVCSGASFNCSGCVSGNFLYNLGCYQSCPVGSYTSANICIACLQANCSVCNATACTACLTGSFFFNGSCLTTCLSNYFSLNGNCVPCATTCLVCSPTNGSCSSCLTPNLLYGGACYSSCPSGVFQQLNSNLCQVCQSPCASCSVYSTNCTSCVRTFNGSSYFYLAYTCYSGQCPDGYYGDTNSQCVGCSSGCATCLSTGCLTCASSFLLYQGACYSQCPNGTFQNSSACLTCVSICRICLSASVCTSCISGYNLFNSTCLLSCPAYYYSNNSICLQCSSPCSLCNLQGCLSCVGGFYLQGTTCTASCTGSNHPNNSTMVCQSCQTPCQGCTWSSSCTSCVNGYSLLGTSCLSACPSGLYSNGAQCLVCPTNCTTCTYLNNQPACNSCAGSLLLYSFTCVGSCPNETTSLNGYCVSKDCSSLPHCTSCSGSQCIQCAAFYSMDSSYSCSQSVSSSAVANALLSIPVPFPFLICIIMVIIIAFLLKHNFPKMFSPLFIYSIAGGLEFLCFVLWTLLSVFWNIGLQQPLAYGSVVYAPVLIGCVYVVMNVIQFILWKVRVVPDRQYRLWQKQDNRCASISIAIVALLFSFRLDALKFSRTGHNPHLSARVASPDVFKHYSVLAVLSLGLSAISMVVSVYVSYLQTSLNYLFFTGFEVAIIAIIMMVLSIAMLCVSRAQLLEDRNEYQVGYDQDQIQGKSVQELLNGLGVVEQHHQHNHYDDSGNAVVMKNQCSSQHYSQDLTLMQPAQLLQFQDKVDSNIQLKNQLSRSRINGKEKSKRKATTTGEDIFGQEAEISSDSHILVDEFERDKNEALELAKHYGLFEQPPITTYPRQAGTIVKQRLPSLHDQTDQMDSVGSFEQFAVDITKGKWSKQENAEQLAGETVKAQGEQQAEQKRQQDLRNTLEQLKLQQIEKKREIQKELQRQQQLSKQQELKRQQQAQLEKKRIMEQRKRKIEAQKQRQFEWNLKKDQAKLQKKEQERLLVEKMEALRREEELLRIQMKQEEEREAARIQQQRARQLQLSRRQIARISKLKAQLEALEGIAEQFQNKSIQLQKEQTELRLHEQERQRESKERKLMAVEDRLSRMAIVFEQMWKKTAEIKHRPSRKIQNSEEKSLFINPIQYHNSDQDNLVSQLSPRKIKINPKPLPQQYTRKHLFVEQGRQILEPNSDDEEFDSEELEIVFEGQGNIQQQKIGKPKSILHHRTNKAKIDYLHYHDYDLKQVEELKLKQQLNKTIIQGETSRATHKQMPKQDTEEPIQMVFQDIMAQVLEQQEPEEEKSQQQSHPKQQQQEYDPIDVNYVGRPLHSSSDTHWPIQPEMHERILQIQRRADRYISQPLKKEQQSRKYVEVTPEDRIYQQEEDGDTQLGEIVFQESDQILQNDSRATGIPTGRSPPSSSSGRRRYPTGRVNRTVIDLSPPK